MGEGEVVNGDERVIVAGKSGYCIIYMYEIVKNKFDFVKIKSQKQNLQTNLYEYKQTAG